MIDEFQAKEGIDKLQFGYDAKMEGYTNLVRL